MSDKKSPGQGEHGGAVAQGEVPVSGRKDEDLFEMMGTPENVGGEQTAGKQMDFACLRGSRVLVVEDSAPMRGLLAQTLSRVGATACEAADGIEALGALRKAYGRDEPFQLVLLDLMMPRMSGFDTLQHIRTDPDLQHTLVMVVTARGKRKDVLQCAQLGISGYVVKPFELRMILEMAEAALAEPPACGGVSERAGLSVEEVRELRRVAREAAENSEEPGGSDVQEGVESMLGDDPVLSAVLTFLNEHCPESRERREEVGAALMGAGADKQPK